MSWKFSFPNSLLFGLNSVFFVGINGSKEKTRKLIWEPTTYRIDWRISDKVALCICCARLCIMHSHKRLHCIWMDCDIGRPEYLEYWFRFWSQPLCTLSPSLHILICVVVVIEFQFENNHKAIMWIQYSFRNSLVSNIYYATADFRQNFLFEKQQNDNFEIIFLMATSFVCQFIYQNGFKNLLTLSVSSIFSTFYWLNGNASGFGWTLNESHIW